LHSVEIRRNKNNRLGKKEQTACFISVNIGYEKSCDPGKLYCSGSQTDNKYRCIYEQTGFCGPKHGENLCHRYLLDEFYLESTKKVRHILTPEDV
jgi:hypothetical protein